MHASNPRADPARQRACRFAVSSVKSPRNGDPESFAALEQRLDGGARTVGHREEFLVARRDRSVSQQRVADPFGHPRPVILAEEDDREIGQLVGLHQRQRLEQFVECAVATRKDDKPDRVLDEHRLPHEEELEVERTRQVPVGVLLVRQLDIAADRDSLRFIGALVGRLHDPRTAARDHRHARLGEQAPGLFRGLVHRIGRLGAGRSEDRHAAGDVLQVVEAPDELAHDAEHAPRVRRDPQSPHILGHGHVE